MIGAPRVWYRSPARRKAVERAWGSLTASASRIERSVYSATASSRPRPMLALVSASARLRRAGSAPAHPVESRPTGSAISRAPPLSPVVVMAMARVAAALPASMGMPISSKRIVASWAWCSALA